MPPAACSYGSAAAAGELSAHHAGAAALLPILVPAPSSQGALTAAVNAELLVSSCATTDNTVSNLEALHRSLLTSKGDDDARCPRDRPGRAGTDHDLFATLAKGVPMYIETLDYNALPLTVRFIQADYHGSPLLSRPLLDHWHKDDALPALPQPAEAPYIVAHLRVVSGGAGTDGDPTGADDDLVGPTPWDQLPVFADSPATATVGADPDTDVDVGGGAVGVAAPPPVTPPVTATLNETVHVLAAVPGDGALDGAGPDMAVVVGGGGAVGVAAPPPVEPLAAAGGAGDMVLGLVGADLDMVAGGVDAVGEGAPTVAPPVTAAAPGGTVPVGADADMVGAGVGAADELPRALPPAATPPVPVPIPAVAVGGENAAVRRNTAGQAPRTLAMPTTGPVGSGDAAHDVAARIDAELAEFHRHTRVGNVLPPLPSLDGAASGTTGRGGGAAVRPDTPVTRGAASAPLVRAPSDGDPGGTDERGDNRVAGVGTQRGSAAAAPPVGTGTGTGNSGHDGTGTGTGDSGHDGTGAAAGTGTQAATALITGSVQVPTAMVPRRPPEVQPPPTLFQIAPNPSSEADKAIRADDDDPCWDANMTKAKTFAVLSGVSPRDGSGEGGGGSAGGSPGAHERRRQTPHSPHLASQETTPVADNVVGGGGGGFHPTLGGLPPTMGGLPPMVGGDLPERVPSAQEAILAALSAAAADNGAALRDPTADGDDDNDEDDGPAGGDGGDII